MKQYTFRQYFLFLTLIPLLTLAVCLELFFVFDRFSSLDEEILDRGMLIARQLSISSEYGVFSNNRIFLESISEGAMKQTDVKGLFILDANSEILIKEGVFDGAPESSNSFSIQSFPSVSGSINNAIGFPLNHIVNAARPILITDKDIWIYQPILSTEVKLDELTDLPMNQDLGSIILEMSLENTQQLKSHLLWASSGLTALFLLISLLLVYLASRIFSNPVLKMSAATQKIGQGDLDTRVSITTRITELDLLAKGINEMAKRLKQENQTLQSRVEEATRIAAIAFDSHEGMMVTDAQGTLLRVNNAFTSITGYSAEEAIGKNVSILKSSRHDANFFSSMWSSIYQIGTWQGEIWNARKNGDIYPAWLAITSIQNEKGETTYYVATISDITSRLAAEKEIKFMAFYDTLTQLPNRRMLMDRLGHALAVSRRTGKYGAIMFLDLDNFKPLNDKYGHAVGDNILIEAARRIVNSVREMDTVARFGGDEFVVMLSELDTDKNESLNQAGVIAEKIRMALAQPYSLHVQQEANDLTAEHFCTSSIGVTLFSSDDNSVEELLEWSDRAMYKAKRDGRNLIRFNN